MAAVTLIVLLMAFGVAAYWGSNRLLHPPRRALQDYHKEILTHPDYFGLQIQSYQGPDNTPCLLVTPSSRPDPATKGKIARDLIAKRGITLRPWGDIRGTVVLLHGFTGRKEDHLPVAERFCAAGFRCLLIDLPGHGENQAPAATFGKHEVALVENALESAAKKFGFRGQPAFLFGVSQGAAIALQTAAHDNSRWAGVASIASFASLDQPVLRSAETLSPLIGWASPLTSSACGCGVKYRAGFFPGEISPVKAAAKIRIPVFVAHGEKDDYIPSSASKAIYDALPGPNKTLKLVKGATHHTVLSGGSHTLYADIATFFLKTMGDKKVLVKKGQVVGTRG